MRAPRVSVQVSAEPVIVEDDLTGEDECLILASDGVWEFVSSQEALDICYQHRDNAALACKALIKYSAQTWEMREGNYRDDITAIVVFLPVLSVLQGMQDIEQTAVYDTAGEQRDHATGVSPQPVRSSDSAPLLVNAVAPAVAASDLSSVTLTPKEEGGGGGDEQPTSEEATFIRRRLSVAIDMEASPEEQ